MIDSKIEQQHSRLVEEYTRLMALMNQMATEDTALWLFCRNRMYEVEDALRRCHQGTYGICQKCQGQIEDARLGVVLGTRWCSSCAAEEARAQSHA